MKQELVEFTRQALERNIPRKDIAAALAQSGWEEPDIRSALSAFAEVNFPLPVPRPRPYLSAREFFIYVVMFAALYDTCYSIGDLIFSFINRTWPDAAENIYAYHHYYMDSIRWTVAHLLISFPLFMFLFNSTSKAIAADPVRRDSKPRKWLTYITLMIATLSLTCDLGTLIYNVLGGELTTRFILKVITVAMIAGTIFAYFLIDSRKGEEV